ncbi:SCP-like protein [Oesophagostomum dentatum]|uniref:SCP-like protein n=1 Tax=Oesophagostomum dentatum TaxID=61180 RepID=A0A0B1T199_OESDE|nr:SCP-like protein [Oesophagostomum dentatum]
MLASGQVTKRNGNYMPQAANMVKLKYDCTLEISARDKAASCSTAENTNRAYQENAHILLKSNAVDRPDAMRQSVIAWWKQVRLDEPIGAAVTFRARHANMAVRSFTRMAWASTTNMGCAVKSCGDYWYSVCHYSPAGNVIGSQIYLPGTPCSACPANTRCDYGLSLCVA